jgi:hypothetical protein
LIFSFAVDEVTIREITVILIAETKFAACLLPVEIYSGPLCVMVPDEGRNALLPVDHRLDLE